jgi:uncharacterized protein HemY
MIVIRGLVLGSCLMTAQLVLAPRPAAACGMYVAPIQYMKPQRADELLAQAVQKIDDGAWASAARLANRIAAHRGPRADQRAQALALAGLAAWQVGAKARALALFKRARQLDAPAVSIEGVLAHVKAPDQRAALRAALEA